MVRNTQIDVHSFICVRVTALQNHPIRGLFTVRAFRHFHCQHRVSLGEEHTKCYQIHGKTWRWAEKQLLTESRCHTIGFYHRSRNCTFHPSKAVKIRFSQSSLIHSRSFSFDWGSSLYHFRLRLCTGRYSFNHLGQMLSMWAWAIFFCGFDTSVQLANKNSDTRSAKKKLVRRECYQVRRIIRKRRERACN